MTNIHEGDPRTELPNGNNLVNRLATEVQTTGRSQEATVNGLVVVANSLWNDQNFRQKLTTQGINMSNMYQEGAIEGDQNATPQQGYLGYRGALRYTSRREERQPLALIPSDALLDPKLTTPEQLFQAHLFASSVVDSLGEGEVNELALEGIKGDIPAVRTYPNYFIRTGFMTTPAFEGRKITPYFYIPSWTLTYRQRQSEEIEATAGKILAYLGQKAAESYKQGQVIID